MYFGKMFEQLQTNVKKKERKKMLNAEDKLLSLFIFNKKIKHNERKYVIELKIQGGKVLGASQVSDTPFPLPQVQTEIKKTWQRWTLAFDWKGPVGLVNYRYRSVLTSVNGNSSVQSQVPALLGNRGCRSSRRSSRTCVSHSTSTHTHLTLPGYVFSSSDAESLPPSIPEENEEEAKHIDDITLRESRRDGAKSLDIVLEREAEHINAFRDNEAYVGVAFQENGNSAGDILLKDTVHVRYSSLDQEEELEL